MKRIDASPKGILEITWSPDSQWLAYTAGDEIRLADVRTCEIRTLGNGSSPRLTPDKQVLFENNQEIHLTEGSKSRAIITKSQVIKDTPKGLPLPSPDGSNMIFVIFNVFDKVSQSLNAYPYRHFLGMATPNGSDAKIIKEQWYGGGAFWFPDSSHFAHFEFDSTAGPQIHIVNAKGAPTGQIAGLYPAISPDSTQIAAKPRNGGSIMVYRSKGGWDDDAVEMQAIKLPVTKRGRPSACAPIWLDNRVAIVIEEEGAFRVDTKRDKAELIKKFTLPTDRRSPSAVPSPDRELIALEVAVDDGFELQVGKPL